VPIGFPVILKCLTLNDPEIAIFMLKCFRRRFDEIYFCLAFGDNYVKTNEDTPILSATKMFARTLVYGDIRFWCGYSL